MTTKSLKQIVGESNSVQWNRNWEEDVQPGKFPSHQKYMEMARKLRAQAIKQIKSFLELAPSGILKDDMGEQARYYSLDGREYNGIKTTTIDNLIAEIEANEGAFIRKALHKKELDAAVRRGDAIRVMDIVKASETTDYANLAPDNRFLKNEESIVRKLKEYEKQGIGHPEKIGDYLRMQILFDNTEDLARGRYAMQFSNALSLSSQKDKLRWPDKESGHRSFMSRAEVSDDNYFMHFETMLSLFQAETFTIDKAFRHSERVSHETGNRVAEKQPGLSKAYYAAANTLEQLRKISFYGLYDGIEGMNDLLSEEVDIPLILGHAEALAIFNAQASGDILAKLPSVAKRFPKIIDRAERHAHLH